jgi:hypothetical protein
MQVTAHKSLRTRPAIPSRAKRCRVHRIPSYVRDDRETPLCVGRDGETHKDVSTDHGSEIFLQKGLDSPVNKAPDGQITTRQREHIPLVSRTRCNVLHVAPQSRDLSRHFEHAAGSMMRTITPDGGYLARSDSANSRLSHLPLTNCSQPASCDCISVFPSSSNSATRFAAAVIALAATL